MQILLAVHWYNKHKFALPGESDGLSAVLAVPHDTTHILSGYNTTYRGEISVSTFTAGMHREEPMGGHILPVIFSWHIGIELAENAGSHKGALDPEAFWPGSGNAGGRFCPSRGFLERCRSARERISGPLRWPAPGFEGSPSNLSKLESYWQERALREGKATVRGVVLAKMHGPLPPFAVDRYCMGCGMSLATRPEILDYPLLGSS